MENKVNEEDSRDYGTIWIGATIWRIIGWLLFVVGAIMVVICIVASWNGALLYDDLLYSAEQDFYLLLGAILLVVPCVAIAAIGWWITNPRATKFIGVVGWVLFAISTLYALFVIVCQSIQHTMSFPAIFFYVLASSAFAGLGWWMAHRGKHYFGKHYFYSFGK